MSGRPDARTRVTRPPRRGRAQARAPPPPAPRISQVEHPSRPDRQGLELAVDPLAEASVDVEDGVEHLHGQAELPREGEESVGVLGQGPAGERNAAADAVAAG